MAFNQITQITCKLTLDDIWNKEIMPHQGRHPNAYHDYMLENIKKIDMIAKGEKELFIELFEQLKQKTINNPDMLNKKYWEGE